MPAPIPVAIPMAIPGAALAAGTGVVLVLAPALVLGVMNVGDAAPGTGTDAIGEGAPLLATPLLALLLLLLVLVVLVVPLTLDGMFFVLDVKDKNDNAPDPCTDAGAGVGVEALADADASGCDEGGFSRGSAEGLTAVTTDISTGAAVTAADAEMFGMIPFVLTELLLPPATDAAAAAEEAAGEAAVTATPITTGDAFPAPVPVAMASLLAVDALDDGVGEEAFVLTPGLALAPPLLLPLLPLPPLAAAAAAAADVPVVLVAVVVAVAVATVGTGAGVGGFRGTCGTGFSAAPLIYAFTGGFSPVRSHWKHTSYIPSAGRNRNTTPVPSRVLTGVPIENREVNFSRRTGANPSFAKIALPFANDRFNSRKRLSRLDSSWNIRDFKCFLLFAAIVEANTLGAGDFVLLPALVLADALVLILLLILIVFSLLLIFIDDAELVMSVEVAEGPPPPAAMAV
jgi:hypothetical protein